MLFSKVVPFKEKDINNEKIRNMLAIKGADIKNTIPKLNNVCPIDNRPILVSSFLKKNRKI